MKNQQKIYEALLRTRILIQPIVVAASRMPINEEDRKRIEIMHAEKWKEGVEQIEKIQKQIIECGRMIVQDIPGMENVAKDIKTADDLADMPASWCNETLDALYNHTKITSGQIAGDKFKVINQSIVHQIDSLVDDPRIISRTKVKRFLGTILGQPEDDSAVTLESGHQMEYDSIYDDGDFYQSLLNEAIASATQSKEEGERLLKQAKYALRRSKKMVDRRATKGRKLKYALIPKLVNFMAPAPAPDIGESTNQLFANLFGHGNFTVT